MRVTSALTAIVAALVVPGCKASGPSSAPPVAAPAPSDAIVGTLGDAGAKSSSFALPAATKQLVTAVTDDWSATRAELRLWTRDGARWTQVGASWAGVVGVSGTAWGTGLHGAGAPAGREGPTKREGDGRSPAGVFELVAAFGYGAAPPAGTALGYQQVDANWKCVDDPASRAYNRVLDARTTRVDWSSAEDMRRADDAYTWVVEVAHNAARIPAGGSCIFLHVWSGPDSHTVGCTAMPAERLATLIGQLAPGSHPAFVLLPRAEYEALASAWGLPSL